ncbi:molybdopterin molybdotransferase MoeA [Streptomyces niveus]|uniref:Molybdopterin molybdenumtransferase n=1 Tax=Streptomyces niveus TaxID=193462 RepID=A0A1U9QTQ2_STRNV|nr:molybdopterin molybdotransferase MoeA [Streptomyces niveus]AQU67600.1 molybdopterin molybdenumtransferase MoeA [Streptomyces niveus]
MTAQDREVDGVEDVLALFARQPDEPDEGSGGRRDTDRTASGPRAPGGREPKPAPNPDAASPKPAAGTRRHRATPWAEARAIAARSGRSAATAPATANAPARTRRVPLEQALGHVLAEPLAALTDLPSFDTSAMDGWAVSGPGPWSVRPDQTDQADHPDEPAASTDIRLTLTPTPGILAGHAAATPLPDGTAVRIATGARIPPDATAVVRSEHARTDSTGHLHAERAVVQGQDIRPRAQECRSGDRLLPAGAVVTPAVLGLAAAAGYDELLTARRPTVDVLVLGDELLVRGLPRDGLIRDALGPMIAPWLRALGADVIDTRRVADDAHALFRAITESEADLILTTGGTAAGPVDHVHPVLARAGAELLVDGVAVRPGHPMLLARLASGRHLVGLPGNPLAAVSGLLTLAEPLLRTLGGRVPQPAYHAPVRDEVHGHPYDTRLVPFVHRDDRLVPLRYNGPAMLRGIAVADGLAVVPPGGARQGDELEVLDLPWAAWADASASTDDGCFT